MMIRASQAMNRDKMNHKYQPTDGPAGQGTTTMAAKMTMMKLATLLLFALAATGCDGQGFVFGNMFFMGVTCFMLWSTINLKKGD